MTRKTIQAKAERDPKTKVPSRLHDIKGASQNSPTTKSLTFGTGGVDDADDAEIILHEYGHAIQDDQIPGFGEPAEAGAMGEGFGDYFAASFFAESKARVLRPTIGNWD